MPTQTPEQRAEEMAALLAKKVLTTCVGHRWLDYTSAKDLILQELNLVELLRDEERLDWLQSQDMIMDSKELCISVKDTNLRLAIDTATAKQKEDK